MDLHHGFGAMLEFFPEETGEVGKTKASPHPGRMASRGDLPHPLTGLWVEHGTMSPGNPPVQESKPRQTLPISVIPSRHNRLPSEKLPLAKIDGKVETCVKGCPFPGELLSIKGVSHLKPKEIPGP
jgi:hypothetical protein